MGPIYLPVLSQITYQVTTSISKTDAGALSYRPNLQDPYLLRGLTVTPATTHFPLRPCPERSCVFHGCGLSGGIENGTLSSVGIPQFPLPPKMALVPYFPVDLSLVLARITEALCV